MQTLYNQLQQFRNSNPVFTVDGYTLQYLNTIADILLNNQQSKVNIVVKSNGKETTAVKPNKLEKAVIK